MINNNNNNNNKNNNTDYACTAMCTMAMKILVVPH